MAPRSKLVAIHPIHGYAIKPQQDLKTIKRNERERNRVETVNRGFETLRQHVPTAASVKKMSKVNILAQAVDYIMYLQQMLDTSETMSSPYPYPDHTHHQYHQQQLQSPYHPHLAQLTPSSYSDTSNHGYYSDTSLQSPALSRSSSWPNQTSQTKPSVCWTSPESSVSAWVQSPHIKQELPDSTTEMADSSGDEEDVLDAIAEWQRM